MEQLDRSHESHCEIADTLFQWLPLPALIHDESIIVDVNTEALRVFGADSADQIIGRHIQDVVHPDAHQAGEARRKMLLGGHRFIGVTTTLVRTDGERIEATGGAIPFGIGDRKLAVAIIFELDCPASVFGDAPQEMRPYPADYSPRAAALDVTPAPIVALSGATIAYANPAAYTLIGASDSSQLIGRSILEIVHDDMRDALNERISLGFMNASLEIAAPGKVRAFDGSVMNVAAKGQSIDSDGAPLRVWAITQVSPREFPQDN